MSWLERLQRLRGRATEEARAGSAPLVVVAAFGKHPGWDDHIDEIGLETRPLIDLKRWLYVEGIRTLIDSGVWEELTEEQRFNRFDHWFLWKVGKEMIIGRMWPSKDGKGRARYPMVVAIHGQHVPPSGMLRQALPALDHIEQACRESTTAEAVRGIIDRAQRDLQRRAEASASTPDAAAEPLPDPAALGRLATKPPMGDRSEGVHRLLYHIERELGAYRPRSDSEARTSTQINLRPRHLRVPACGERPAEVLATWYSVLAGQLSSGAPVLLMLPNGQSWLDVVVGLPDDGSLRPLQATPNAVPLVTDVPYRIEPGTAQRYDEMIRESAAQDSTGAPRRAGDTPAADQRSDDDEGPGQPPDHPDIQAMPRQDTSRAPSPDDDGSAGGRRSTEPGPKKSSSIWRWSLILAIAAIITGAAMMVMNPPRGSPEQIAPAASPEVRVHNWAWVARDPEGRSLLREFGEAATGQAEDSPDRQALAELAEQIQAMQRAQRDREPAVTIDPVDSRGLVESLDRLEQALSRGIASLEEAADALRREGWSEAAAELRRRAEAIRAHLRAAARLDQAEAFDQVLAEAIAGQRLARQVIEQWRALRAAGVELAGDAPMALDEHWTALAANDTDLTLEELAEAVERRRASHQSRLAEAEALDARLNALRESPAADAALVQLLPTMVRDDLSATQRFDGDDGFDRRLTMWNARTKELANLVEARWPDQIDVGELARLAERENLPSQAPAEWEDVERWIELVRSEETALLPAEHDPRDADAEALASLVEAVRRFEVVCGDEIDESLMDRHERFAERVNEVLGMPWTGTRAAAARIEQEWGDITREAGAIEATVAEHIETCWHACEQRLAELNQPLRDIVAADVLREHWDRVRQSVTAGEAACHEQVDLLARWRRGMIALDAKVARPDRAIVPDVPDRVIDQSQAAEVIAAERERVLSEVLADLPPVDAPPDAAGFAARSAEAAAAYAAWLEHAAVMLDDYAAMARHLEAARPSEDVLAAGRRDNALAWREEAIHRPLASAVHGIDRRVDRLIEIESMPIDNDRDDFTDRREMVALALDPQGDPEARMAAWRRAGEATQDPELLQQELSLREALELMAASMGGDEAERVMDEIRQGQRQRWLEHVRHVRDPQRLDDAFAFSQHFGVERDQDDLDDVLRINLDLHALRQLVRRDAFRRGGPEDEELTAHVGQIIAQLELMAADVPAAQSIAHDLCRLLERGDDEMTDWRRIGPGRAGWEARPSADGRVIRFDPPESARSTAPLVFLRVEMPDDAPVFMTQSEVSLGQFIAAIDAAVAKEHEGAWVVISELLGRTHSADGRDLRRGPRVWDWRDPSNPRAGMRVSERWLRSEPPYCYPEAIDPDAPSPAHPMQYVSPAAALYVAATLGCRLPTTEEWQVAREQTDEDSSSAGPRPNLRGSAFRAQVDHMNQRIERMQPVQFDRPNEGTFRTEPRDDERIWPGQEQDADDRLWFHHAGGGHADESSFADLVGNVAEFVYDRPATFERRFLETPEHRFSHEELLDHLEDAHSSDRPALFVIGASALSHPDLGMTSAHSVTRAVPSADWRTRGFSDVGFRLALPAHAIVAVQESLPARLAAWMDTPRYLVDHPGD